MTKKLNVVNFLDYLPELFRTGSPGEENLLSVFLKSPEKSFNQLRLNIENSSDLYNPDKINPESAPYSDGSEYDFLKYLAEWIALPLREDKSFEWNREFFKKAVKQYPHRGTLDGMENMLRAWMAGELLESTENRPFISDLGSDEHDSDSAFQLGVKSQLGIDSVLGEGPPYFFVVDLVLNPGLKETKNPYGLETIFNAAKFILNNEKPYYTYYDLTMRRQSMQLAPDVLSFDPDSSSFAQVGVTTMLSSTPITHKGS